VQTKRRWSSVWRILDISSLAFVLDKTGESLGFGTPPNTTTAKFNIRQADKRPQHPKKCMNGSGGVWSIRFVWVIFFEKKK
jgi:hypothetical protein